MTLARSSLLWVFFSVDGWRQAAKSKDTIRLPARFHFSERALVNQVSIMIDSSYVAGQCRWGSQGTFVCKQGLSLQSLGDVPALSSSFLPILGGEECGCASQIRHEPGVEGPFPSLHDLGAALSAGRTQMKTNLPIFFRQKPVSLQPSGQMCLF